MTRPPRPRSSSPITLLVVCLLILLSGWIGVGLNTALRHPDSMESPGTLLWLITPLVLVIIVRALRRTRVPGRWAPRLRTSWPYYLHAILIFPVAAALAAGIGAATGQVSLTGFSLRGLAAVILTGFLATAVKNIFEEAVWRGYLTGELVHRRWSDAQIYLTVGAIWGLWHLPYYLYFLPETELTAVTTLPPWGFAALACAVMIIWAVVFTELYRLSGSIWTVVLLHTVEDLVLNPLILDGHLGIATGSELLFSPIYGLISLAVVLTWGLVLRQLRRREQPDAPHTQSRLPVSHHK